MTEVPVITEAPDVSEDTGKTKVDESKENEKYVKVNKRVKHKNYNKDEGKKNNEMKRKMASKHR